MSLLERLEKSVTRTALPPQEVQDKDVHRELRAALHKKVVAEFSGSIQGTNIDMEEVAGKIENLVAQQLAAENGNLSRTERERLTLEIINDAIGFGPITPLLEDPAITEVMVNGPDSVYVERSGRLELSGVQFRDQEHVYHVIEKIVAPIGRRIDEGSPMVDARLPDGSRVNVIIPPLSLTGPVITIRKFYRDPLKVEDLIRMESITEEMFEFLDACVKARLNIVVSGGTGSGKTTTLNVLSSLIPASDRIVTIEDSAELQLRQNHVITLESRPPNIENKGAIHIRDLVRNSLRMRPDRIVVGEVRGGGALDMLQAMNTGHDGSLTTGHANTPRDMLSRLETMVLMAGMEIPVRAIREQISSAIDLIIQQARMRDGSRKITHITEVQGMEGDIITLQDLFIFKQTGVDEQGKVVGQFTTTGIKPRFMDRFEAAGINLRDDLFAGGYWD